MKKISSKSFPYNIEKPDSIYTLPSSLLEISGLEYFGEGMLACVEDENGILYLFDPGSGKVTRKLKFGKKGDYEGVAVSGDSIWVIKSNGQLYMFRPDDGDSVDAGKWELPLTADNDIEGLCYNPRDHSLLVACKEQAGIRDKLKGRAVYRFDIRIGKLDPDPYLLLTGDVYTAKLRSFGLHPEDHSPFKPSGISIDPLTGNIYMISSIGKLLIVINNQKEIISMVPLSGKFFLQPEGICFSPEGTMYISSEGNNKGGYIFRFDRLE